MTIAFGFRCQGNVLLCADTEITGAVHKWSGIKVQDMVWTPQIGLAVAFAGWVDYARMACEKIVARVLDTKAEFASIFSVIEKTVLEIYKGPIAAHPGREKPVFSLLIAVRIAGEQSVSLIKTVDTAVCLGDSFEAIGMGAELAGYLWSNVTETNLSLEEGALAAAYILHEVKNNVAYCGKSSLIVSLGLDGIKLSSSEKLSRLEKEFKRRPLLNIGLPSKVAPNCSPILENAVTS